MDNFARYTPQFSIPSQSLPQAPRLQHFEYPYASILSFTFQDAYKRQNSVLDSLYGARCTAFGNMRRFLRNSGAPGGSLLPENVRRYLNGTHGFVFYESMSHIFGFGLVNESRWADEGGSYSPPHPISPAYRTGLVTRFMPQGLKGVLLYGQFAPSAGGDNAGTTPAPEDSPFDIYGALDWRGKNPSQWTANAFLGLRLGQYLRVEANSRIREVNMPQMHSATLNAVYTLFRRAQTAHPSSPPPTDRFSYIPFSQVSSVDVGSELSLVEGMPNNAFAAVRVVNAHTTTVLGLTLLGHVRFLYGYSFSDYLKFASLFEMHLTTYRSDAVFAAQFVPRFLPANGEWRILFARNLLLRHLRSITGRVDLDKGVACKVELGHSEDAGWSLFTGVGERMGSLRESKVNVALSCEVPYPNVQNWVKKIALGVDMEVEW